MTNKLEWKPIYGGSDQIWSISGDSGSSSYWPPGDWDMIGYPIAYIPVI